MPIRTFCTTLCAALAALAAVPAAAFELPAGPGQVTALTLASGVDTYRHAFTSRQPAGPAGHMVLDANTFAGMLSTETLPGSGSANDATAQFWQTGAGGIAWRPYGQEENQPVPEGGNLPLLGAAAIALLVAQLRRSRRPAVR